MIYTIEYKAKINMGGEIFETPNQIATVEECSIEVLEMLQKDLINEFIDEFEYEPEDKEYIEVEEFTIIGGLNNE